MIAYTRRIWVGDSLLYTSTSTILLQDRPPLESQIAVHLFCISASPLPCVSVRSPFALWSRATCLSSPHMEQITLALQLAAWWPSNRQRKQSLAPFIHSVFSSSDFAAKALHSNRSWPSRSWSGHRFPLKLLAYEGVSCLFGAGRAFVLSALRLALRALSVGWLVGWLIDLLPAKMLGLFFSLAWLWMTFANLPKLG